MDILRFINSKDIRNHLKKIGYKFNSLEAAWIIHHSRRATLDEKIEAWNDIMETMPDCEINERRGFDAEGSLFEMLKAYIKLMRKLIKDTSPEYPQLQKALIHRCYKYEYEQEGRPEYRTFDTLTDFLKGWEKEDKEGITGYRIETVFVEEKDIFTGTISVRFNPDLKVMSIDAYGDKYLGVQNLLHDFFESMWFDFPVPFKKGDIIWDPEKKEGLCGGPFVVRGVGLNYISSEKAKEHVRRYGDSSDMNAWGTFIGEEGSIYDEVMDNYMDCEYYRGPFEGKYAILKTVSSFRKGEIDETLFTRAYHAIRLKLMAEKSMPRDYTEEIKERAGIKDEDIKLKTFNKKKRKDKSPVKRVELHCHTNMSAMSGIDTADDIIERASEWGMSAIAITDRDSIRAFTDAYRKASKIQNPPKIIYGLEAYLPEDDGDFSNLNISGISYDYQCHSDGIDKIRICLLAKNETGMKNLNKLLTEAYAHRYVEEKNSYEKYLLLTKELLDKYRDGLLVGMDITDSDALFLYLDFCEDLVEEWMDYFDYIEIQPIRNLTKNKFYGDIIEKFYKAVIKAGKEKNKPVVAVSDSYFIDPEDSIYRRILAGSVSMPEDEANAPKFLRTTEEMLEEFHFLGETVAKEVVIDNPLKVADMIEDVCPVSKYKYPIHMDEAELKIVPDIYRKCLEQYKLMPNPVEERIEKELKAISDNGFLDLYALAKLISDRSRKEGHPVGFHGCVGASLIAYFAGITDINPLPAHYYCPECGYFEIADNSGALTGSDLPHKTCPECGKMLYTDGYGIPFETFAGYMGNKEPDIDLDLDEEYIPKAREHVKDIFGRDCVIIPGTYHMLHPDEARKLVDKYFDSQGIIISEQIKENIVDHLRRCFTEIGVHPCGLLVLPSKEEISDITPVQPVNRSDGRFSDDKVTHFDYHSIDHNLTRIDLLPNKSLSLLKRLYELTGVDPEEIEFDNPQVLRMVLDGDCHGIPEFERAVFKEAVKAAKPENIGDLIRIEGLIHGTDTWKGNAKELIESGLVKLKDVISNRDDIMNSLLSKGMEPEEAYHIMESVRKGKGIKPEWENDMILAGIPRWYIDSAKKICYLFPKAHSAVHIKNSLKIAYYKCYHNTEFLKALEEI